jgi:hypothetical protein
MRTLLVLGLLMMSTAACGTVPSKVPLPVCPQIVEYGAADQARAADELQRLPASGVVRSRFMPDYGRMRAEVRACRGGA